MRESLALAYGEDSQAYLKQKGKNSRMGIDFLLNYTYLC